MSRRTCLVIGLVLFLAGGAVLAFVSGTAGTGAGTGLGLLGLGLAAWGLFKPPS